MLTVGFVVIGFVAAAFLAECAAGSAVLGAWRGGGHTRVATVLEVVTPESRPF